MDQDAINALLVARGRAGQTVVRLKGGDPFVFGRGGEEAMALHAAAVDFEVVPGVTSAVAVPAYAGIPVTHRGLATSFTVVTGHSRHAVDTETNWDALAAAGGTIVVLMGVAHRAEIAARLIAGGLAPATPVAAVRWGTRPDQVTLRTTLGDLGAAPLEPPATIVVGPVAGLDLDWFERRPLFGRRIVVTRARDQAGALAARLRALGAEPVELPTIRVAPAGRRRGGAAPGGRAVAAGRYRVGGLHLAQGRGAAAAHAPRRPELRPRTQVAAIGPGTAAALAARGVAADLVPGEFVAESLLDALPAGSGRVLLPRAARPATSCPTGLRAKGWQVDVVEAYRTEPDVPGAAARAAVASADAITFTSSSTVTNYLAVAGTSGLPPVVVCIGPVTARGRGGGRDPGRRRGRRAQHRRAGGLPGGTARSGQGRSDDDGRSRLRRPLDATGPLHRPAPATGAARPSTGGPDHAVPRAPDAAAAPHPDPASDARRDAGSASTT